MSGIGITTTSAIAFASVSAVTEDGGIDQYWLEQNPQYRGLNFSDGLVALPYDDPSEFVRVMEDIFNSQSKIRMDILDPSTEAEKLEKWGFWDIESQYSSHYETFLESSNTGEYNRLTKLFPPQRRHLVMLQPHVLDDKFTIGDANTIFHEMAHANHFDGTFQSLFKTTTEEYLSRSDLQFKETYATAAAVALGILTGTDQNMIDHYNEKSRDHYRIGEVYAHAYAREINLSRMTGTPAGYISPDMLKAAHIFASEVNMRIARDLGDDNLYGYTRGLRLGA